MQEIGQCIRMERATEAIRCKRVHGYRQCKVAVDGECTFKRLAQLIRQLFSFFYGGSGPLAGLSVLVALLGKT